MYPEGYVRQKIHEDGWQMNVDEVLDGDANPISRFMGTHGNQLVVQVPFMESRLSAPSSLPGGWSRNMLKDSTKML
jgi:glucan phosphorylase